MNATKNFATPKVYKGIVIGVLTALGVSLAFSLAFTWLILGGKIGENSMKFSGMITMFAASFGGTTVSVKLIAKQKFITGIIVTAIYFAILLMSTALIFDGQYQNVITNILLGVAGSVTACIMPIGRKKQTSHIRKKRHYR